MPLFGQDHSDLARDEAPFFNSLAKLDAWFTRPHDKLSGVVPYQPRPLSDGSSGQLLVCHDHKGGYTESPAGLCYTFNFWRLCDTFVYFSHHRVTIPPSGWTNTAHRQGTKMLGTLIFEGRDNPDCLQLLVGHPGFVVTDNKIPLSNRYAILLAELACQRGFDGYLLNFEADLKYKANHAHALAAWILLLKAELRVRVGPHARVVWYDSVIYNGQVRYQNRLNGYNLPFFLASDSLFTNYWWGPQTQVCMTEYFANLKLAALGPNSSTDVPSSAESKILQDIYSGVDVFPRNGGIYQYGCGYTCYHAINHTRPRGFSTALFAPGWTWENETENAEANWDEWWKNERKLWLGPLSPGQVIQVPDSTEGPFKPIAAFFPNLPPPDPSKFAFYTHFSPGVGYYWFVEGNKVLDTEKGWTDIDKQSPIGDLVWPWPTPSWESDEQANEAAPTASTVLDMTDGYNGGNTLKLTIACTKSKPESIAKVIWLPVQSLTVTTRRSFEARVVYKITAPNDFDLTPRIHVKSLQKEENDSDAFVVDEVVDSNLQRGWSSQTVNFTSSSTRDTDSVAIGFLVTILPEFWIDFTFSLSLSQLAVYPTPLPPLMSVSTPSITGAKFSHVPRKTNTDAVEGVLTWDTASIFGPIDVEVKDPESVAPAWLLHDTPTSRFPTFVYFNIYVAPLDRFAQADPDITVFVGTTGHDGRANRFYVGPACLLFGLDGWGGVRFYVQGVTDRGDVLPWERCATVDHMKSDD